MSKNIAEFNFQLNNKDYSVIYKQDSYGKYVLIFNDKSNHLVSDVSFVGGMNVGKQKYGTVNDFKDNIDIDVELKSTILNKINKLEAFI